MLVSSISGLKASLDSMNRAAAETAKGVEDGDIIGAQIDMIKAQRSFEANLAMLNAANHMQKALIDIFA